MNILSADIINNFVMENRIYNLEVFYLEDYIHVFASFHTRRDILSYELIGYGGHSSLKDEAIRSAIRDLKQQIQ